MSSLNNIHSLIWQGVLPVSRGGTGASSFTSGSLLFSNGTSFSQDNSNLFWDDISNRLFLGSESSPGTIATPDAISPDTEGVFLEITAGDGFGNGSGGNISVIAGSALTTNGFGGDVRLVGGSNTGGITAGRIDIQGGNPNDSGDIVMFAGIGGEYGGDIDINSGGGSIADGNIYINGNNIELQGTGSTKIVDIDGGYLAAILDTSFIATSDKTFTFPNASGTFGLLEANQIWTGLNKFEASSNSTIYVGSPVKSGCIALGDSDGDGVTYVIANDGVLSASAIKPATCQ